MASSSKPAPSGFTSLVWRIPVTLVLAFLGCSMVAGAFRPHQTAPGAPFPWKGTLPGYSTFIILGSDAILLLLAAGFLLVAVGMTAEPFLRRWRGSSEHDQARHDRASGEEVDGGASTPSL